MCVQCLVCGLGGIQLAGGCRQDLRIVWRRAPQLALAVGKTLLEFWLMFEGVLLAPFGRSVLTAGFEGVPAARLWPIVGTSQWGV